MITNDHDWRVEWRVIPEWPGYTLSTQLEVWSMPRKVRCKGGGTRQKSGKRLEARDGRVYLCHEGRRERFHVGRDLFPRVYPDLHHKVRQRARQRPQTRCHNGHPLIEPIQPEIFGSLAAIVKPRVADWGTGNRICLHCSDPPEKFPTHTFSLQYGTGGIHGYAGPASPKVREDDRAQLAEVEWAERGFIISDYPLRGGA